jgi:hypothetical protein
VVVFAALFALVAEGTAYAQLEKRFMVGASFGAFFPAASELQNAIGVVPTIGRVPKEGFRVAFGLNWYGSDLHDDIFTTAEEFGRFRARPLMAGIGYTIMNADRRLSITPSIVAGPSWNRLEIDDDLRDVFVVSKEGDNDFGSRASNVTFVVRPGVSLIYAVKPRFGVSLFGGYVFNRPKFDIATPATTGSPVTTGWKADGIAIGAGIVVPIF